MESVCVCISLKRQLTELLDQERSRNCSISPGQELGA